METRPTNPATEFTRESETCTNPPSHFQVTQNKLVTLRTLVMVSCNFMSFIFLYFSLKGLKLTTTSRRGPLLGSWLHPVAAPVGFGNPCCRSSTYPSLCVLVYFKTTRKTALIFHHRNELKINSSMSRIRIGF